MAEQSLYQFRLFFRDTPSIFGGWRRYDEERRWDRHYLIAPNMNLRIERGERVELTRSALQDGFEVESTVLSSAFPLDWMALSCIARSLPREFRLVEIDGSSAQAFVDSLAYPDLIQASVLKHDTHMRSGAAMATFSRLEIPDWTATGITVNVSAHRPRALKMALAEMEMDRYRHFGFEAWLAGAHTKAVQRRNQTTVLAPGERSAVAAERVAAGGHVRDRPAPPPDTTLGRRRRAA